MVEKEERTGKLPNTRQQIGTKLIKFLHGKFGTKNNHNLSKCIGCTSVTLNSWENRGITEKGLAGLIYSLSKREYIRGSHLIEALRKGYRVKNNSRLEEKLGITYQTINKYEDQKITAKIIFDIVKKTSLKFNKTSIKPILEFYPLNRELSRNGAMYEVLNVKITRNKTIQSILKRTKGVYIFYNSQGQAIYVGKALKQYLWSEIKSAFNRKRENQTIYRTNYPESGNSFTEVYKDKNRKIRKHNLKLHDLATYLSVYEVESSLISPFEAALIRIFPNQIMNSRVEAFKGLL
jgi:hypothetical protein